MTHSPSPEFQEIHISIGERIVGQATLTTAEIAAFARMCGDHNPLHHDEAYAHATRFGGIIAGGGQLISLTTGLLATYFTQNSAMLGLEFLEFRNDEIECFVPARPLEHTVTLDEWV